MTWPPEDPRSSRSHPTAHREERTEIAGRKHNWRGSTYELTGSRAESEAEVILNVWVLVMYVCWCRTEEMSWRGALRRGQQ